MEPFRTNDLEKGGAKEQIRAVYKRTRKGSKSENGYLVTIENKIYRKPYYRIRKSSRKCHTTDMET